MTKPTLLIDGDVAAYRASIGVETTVEWPNGSISTDVDVDAACAAFRQVIEEIVEAHDGAPYKLALTGPTNFRKSILPTYKGQRKEKPMALQHVKDWAAKNMGAVIKDNIEADDTVGIWATHPKLIPGPKVIVSIDKDLRTIPGKLSKGDGMVFDISVAQANYFFLTQVLTGDTVDNYKGCPGVGPKKADAILRPFADEMTTKFDAREAWLAVVNAFEAKGLTADDALVQARVARILRARDYNFKTKEPILWNPPQSS